VGLILHEADDRTRTQVVKPFVPAFEPYVHGTEVRFTAAVGCQRGCKRVKLRMRRVMQRNSSSWRDRAGSRRNRAQAELAGDVVAGELFEHPQANDALLDVGELGDAAQQPQFVLARVSSSSTPGRRSAISGRSCKPS